MTKAELIESVANDVNLSKADALKAIDSVIAGITDALKKGEKVTLVGFGVFSVAERKARKGRNPRTGDEIEIAASKTPKFSAGKVLKQAIK
ncbi:MAG: HU family DNA-binding protein [Nitrospirae bacterium]|nr:HU family DNA-binding protein [Nitrospirota bacterium]